MQSKERSTLHSQSGRLEHPITQSPERSRPQKRDDLGGVQRVRTAFRFGVFQRQKED